MKKLLLVLPVIALLAAGCNSSQQASVQTNQNTQVATPNTRTQTIQNANQPDYTPPQSNGNTASVKTYTDTNYGFQFTYPANLQVTKSQSVDGKSVTFGVDGVAFSISASNLLLDAYVKDAAQSGGIISDYHKTTLGGLPAYEGVDNGMITAYALYTKNKGYIYRFTLSSNGKDTLAELKTGLSADQKQILAGFTFTK